MPPSKDSVSRAYFTEGVFVLGTMLNSLDEKQNKVAMELHPAGVLVMTPKGEKVIIPYSRVKSIVLG